MKSVLVSTMIVSRVASASEVPLDKLISLDAPDAVGGLNGVLELG